jgi:hypothetical protein
MSDEDAMTTFFTPEQHDTLRAAIDRMIPVDEFPGGWEAGAGDYLFRQLDGDLRELLPLYRDGLDELDAEARAVFATPFAALTMEQQDMLLTRADFGAPILRNPGLLQRFVRILAAHSAEGYYSDPGNGGNRDRVAWNMIGFVERERPISYEGAAELRPAMTAERQEGGQ